MKLNKKNKGKVHPLSPSPSSSSNNTDGDEIAALKLLLPAAILTIITVLSLQEREVLAYMITRSIKASANPAVLLEENRRRLGKKPSPAANSPHKSPAFDCGCFDCYISYWCRWDSSPNRELIHQAIEAFEEHFEHSKNNNNGKGKKKQDEIMISDLRALERLLLAEDVRDSPERVVEEEAVEDLVPEEEEVVVVEVATEVVRTVVGGGGGNHKGLARKVLPDVIGVLNSRLWSLWRPN